MIIRDNHRLLECALRSIERIEYDKKHFEVIVVDDGSIEPIAKQLKISPSFDCKFKYIERSEKSSRSKARNIGANSAVFDYLIFVDGDHFFEARFLATYQNNLKIKPKNSVVLGSRNHFSERFLGRVLSSFLRPGSETFIPKEFSADERILLLKRNNIPFKELLGKWHLFWSCNFLIKKTLFEETNGFDETFLGWGLEDSEFGYRLIHNHGIEIDFIENNVWHCVGENQISKQKVKEWHENIQKFYKKYNDFAILEQIHFEEVYMSAAGIREVESANWFNSYRSFENKLKALKNFNY